MDSTSPVTFEETIDWKVAFYVYLAIAVIVLAGRILMAFVEGLAGFGEIAGFAVVIAFLSVCGYWWFRERHTTIRVDQTGLTVTDISGAKHIPFNQIRSVRLARIGIARHGHYAYLREATDFKTNILSLQPRVNVMYRNPGMFFTLKRGGPNAVLLDIGADKPQAIPCKRIDELLTAIQSGLSR